MDRGGVISPGRALQQRDDGKYKTELEHEDFQLSELLPHFNFYCDQEPDSVSFAGREGVRLVGEPAVQIGGVGGECSAPLNKLHDPWWNRIARAMA
jgi:hypothetical protein